MQCITWSAPILPGKLEAWKKFVEETNGPRLAEHDASRFRGRSIRWLCRG